MLVGLETAPARVILVETSSVVFDLESRLEPVGVVCPDVYRVSTVLSIMRIEERTIPKPDGGYGVIGRDYSSRMGEYEECCSEIR
jgi:hypothetical protein